MLFKCITKAVPVVEAAFGRKSTHVQRIDIRPQHKIDTIPHSQLIDKIVETMACHTVEKGRQLVDGNIQASGQIANAVTWLKKWLAAFHEEGYLRRNISASCGRKSIRIDSGLASHNNIL